MISSNPMRISVFASLLAACGSSGDAVDTDPAAEPTTGGSTSAGTGGAPPQTGDADGSTTAAPATADSTGDASTAGGPSDTGATTGEPAGNAAEWIIAHFVDAPVFPGVYDERTAIETPALVIDAQGSNAKYVFDVREEEEPVLAEVGFVNVWVIDLVSTDAFGGAISTGNAPGAISYLANVYIEPNWPAWESYDTTNYDGIVLDGSAEFYAEDLTIVNWNADSAIDIKADISQFVRLELEGEGNRALRFWRSGPHYLVESSVNNPGGTLLWFRDCSTVTLNVFASTFDGADEVPADSIECDEGEAPTIVYLQTDPRTTGEMHPMFSGG